MLQRFWQSTLGFSPWVVAVSLMPRSWVSRGERIKRSNTHPLTILHAFFLGVGTIVQGHTLLHGNISLNTSNSLMLDLMLSTRDVTCLFEKAVGAGLACLEKNTSSPGNELPSPSRFLITPAQRRTQMVGLKEVISDMSYNKQSESAKPGRATVTADLEQDLQHHTVASIGVRTVDGKMSQGEARDCHVLASIGVATVGGRMLEGKEKEKHKKACVDDGGSKDGTMPQVDARDAHFLANSENSSASKAAERDKKLAELNLKKGGACQAHCCCEKQPWHVET
jgi:hypothetical protein